MGRKIVAPMLMHFLSNDFVLRHLQHLCALLAFDKQGSRLLDRSSISFGVLSSHMGQQTCDRDNGDWVFSVTTCHSDCPDESSSLCWSF